jgi:HlyD family secretion protein
MYRSIMSILLLYGIATVYGCRERTGEYDIEATGTIEAISVRIAAKTAGEVKRIMFIEGSQITTGDTLLILDHERLDIQLRQAEAGVQLAGAQLDLLLEGAREEDIKQAEESLAQVEANMNLAAIDLSRIRNLFDSGSIPRKQLDDAEARFTVSQAQYNAVVQSLEKLKRLTRPDEIRAQEARVEQARASADLLRKSITECTVVSPVDGVVTHRPVEVGELAGQGTTLAVISKLDTVHLMIYLNAVELASVNLGSPVDVIIDAYPERVFSGLVTFISPVAEFTPKNIQTRDERVKLVYAVKVEMENPDGILKPGMPADARVKKQITE